MKFYKIIFFVFIFCLNGCSKMLTTTNSSRIFFVKEPTPIDGRAYYGRAGIGGKLILSKGCIYLKYPNNSRSFLIWPWDYNYVVSNNEVLIKNEKNITVAKVNSQVKFSGGPSNFYKFDRTLFKDIENCYKNDKESVIFVGKQFSK